MTTPGDTAHRGELLIFASSLKRESGGEHLPLGAIVGRVLLVDCYHASIPNTHHSQWVLVFEQPELFKTPVPWKGGWSSFHLPRGISKQLPPRYDSRY